MAGDDPGDGVGPDRGAHGPRRPRHPDSTGQIAVRGDASGRDRQQRAPDLDLERGAAKVQPDAVPTRRGVEDPPRDAGGGARVLDEGGRLEAAGEPGERLVAPLRSGERESAHAAHGTQDQALPERRRVRAVSYGESASPMLVFPRSHRLDVHEEIVQAAGAREAGVVRGVEHAARLREHLLRALQSEELDVLLGAQPHLAPEQALEVVLAQAGTAGRLRQRGLAFEVSRQPVERALDP